MVKKIWWDFGHGGTDPGAVANGLLEKVLTLKIGSYAMAYLEANYTGFEQRATRTNDITVALDKRDDGADAWGADVYVSIHINAGRGNGFESYIYNNLSPKAKQAAIALQNIINTEIMAAMRQFGDIKAHGNDDTREANFSVLRETNMTALLTENLYIDSSDHKYLKQETFLKAVGEAHARGVAKFLGLPSKLAQVQQSAPTSAKRHVKIVNVHSAAIMMDKPDRIYAANIGTIPKGETVDLIVPVAGYNNGNTGYFKIVYDDKAGYINAMYGQEV